MWAWVGILCVIAYAGVVYARGPYMTSYLSSEYRAFGPDEYDRALRATSHFDLERRRRVPCVWRLEAAKTTFQRAAYELGRRLPSDARLEARLRADVEAATTLLQDHIQVARRACPLARYYFPSPLGTYFERDILSATE